MTNFYRALGSWIACILFSGSFYGFIRGVFYVEFCTGLLLFFVFLTVLFLIYYAKAKQFAYYDLGKFIKDMKPKWTITIGLIFSIMTTTFLIVVLIDEERILFLKQKYIMYYLVDSIFVLIFSLSVLYYGLQMKKKGIE